MEWLGEAGGRQAGRKRGWRRGRRRMLVQDLQDPKGERDERVRRGIFFKLLMDVVSPRAPPYGGGWGGRERGRDGERKREREREGRGGWTVEAASSIPPTAQEILGCAVASGAAEAAGKQRRCSGRPFHLVKMATGCWLQLSIEHGTGWRPNKWESVDEFRWLLSLLIGVLWP